LNFCPISVGKSSDHMHNTLFRDGREEHSNGGWKLQSDALPILQLKISWPFGRLRRDRCDDQIAALIVTCAGNNNGWPRFFGQPITKGERNQDDFTPLERHTAASSRRRWRRGRYSILLQAGRFRVVANLRFRIQPPARRSLRREIPQARRLAPPTQFDRVGIVPSCGSYCNPVLCVSFTSSRCLFSRPASSRRLSRRLLVGRRGS